MQSDAYTHCIYIFSHTKNVLYSIASRELQLISYTFGYIYILITVTNMDYVAC